MWTSDMHHSHQDLASNPRVLNTCNLKSRQRKGQEMLSEAQPRWPQGCP